MHRDLRIDTNPCVCDTAAVFTLGDVVRKLREQKGWDQSELARRAKVNKQTIVRIENNPETAKPKTVAKIADALDHTPDSLRAHAPPIGNRPSRSRSRDGSYRRLSEQRALRLEMLGRLKILHRRGRIALFQLAAPKPTPETDRLEAL